MSKYSKEIASVLIGILLIVVIFSVSHIAQKEATEAKNIRAKEVRALLSAKRDVVIKNVSKQKEVRPIKNNYNEDLLKEKDETIKVLQAQNQKIQEEKIKLKKALLDVKNEIQMLKEKEEQEEVVVEKIEIESQPEKIVEAEAEQNKIVPNSFSSYIVSVKIDFKEDTDTQKAINDVKKACSIIGSAPVVQNTEVVGIKGRVCEGDKESLFDLEMEN